MKNLLPLILVMFAALVATSGFIDANRKGDNQLVSQHSKGLSGIQQFLPAGARISFVCNGNDAPLYAACRYVLSPAYLGYRVSLPTDTMLLVNERDKGDSLVQRWVTGSTVLWQKAHLGYDYYLIVKH
jgi:hypothetical protein